MNPAPFLDRQRRRESAGIVFLARPRLPLVPSFRQAIGEDDPLGGDGKRIFDLVSNHRDDRILLMRLTDLERGTPAVLPDGAKVVTDRTVTFWAVSGEAVVGTLSLRPWLPREKSMLYGNVGYWTTPSARRSGVATFMLGEAATMLSGMGVQSPVVVCDKDNVASARTARENGFVPHPDGHVFQEKNGPRLRFVRTA